ncbi:hypothetical protein RGUI_3275 [Rhodovulum sp. P5]|uniref:Tse2 family ADP-ribosyltransferase toxin n=1 Tax=Rhodovulum sp. P5 TaxID=1564506 RepID=UPI0009C29403|nr:hypothetical protein [Rhodovulum sp. P5]ARE41416.1 hypothetical protein RGUI_3275 [Rhodovulum sp. P5]
MATLDKDYYRAANKGQFKKGVWAVDGEEPAAGILHGDIERRYWTVAKRNRAGEIVKDKHGKTVRETRSRQDWSITDGQMDTGSGTSLHDYEGALGYRSWNYFQMPEGTTLPACLQVVQRGSDPHHYQIEVLTGGTVSPVTLRGALDNLARNCVVRQKQLAGTI